jgi:hypothetical protein
VRYKLTKYDEQGERVEEPKYHAEQSASVPICVRKCLDLQHVVEVDLLLESGKSHVWKKAGD